LSASDIDGWILQAKQLRGDIEESQQEAKEIVQLSAQGVELKRQTEDAASKVALLKGEVAFNDSLADTLKKIQAVKYVVDSAQAAVLSGQLLESVALLNTAQDQLQQLPRCENARLVDLISAKITELRENTAKTLTESWNALVRIDPMDSIATVKSEVQSMCQPCVNGQIAYMN